MITVCTNHQHLLMQSHKVWPKDNFVLKEQMESSNLPFVFNTNYIAIAFQKKISFSAIIFSLTLGGFPHRQLVAV